MINIFSVRCSLAFAPYLAESVSAFSDEGEEVSRVVRQGGSGLIMRSDDRMLLRYRNHETALDSDASDHYRSTINFRSEFYDVLRMSDEIVVANIERTLLLSHPQSELWLDAETVSHLIKAFHRGSIADGETLPDWLSISPGGGRLMLSDQRNGRWVLLAADHIEELERRLPSLASSTSASRRPAPATLSLKGVVIHLQSAARLARSLGRFAETQEVASFEEVMPEFALRVGKGPEGMEIRDGSNRAGITVREARKWVAIINDELARLNVSEMVRGSIRTVFADGEGGRWVLQWGDEVFAPDELISHMASGQNDDMRGSPDGPVVKRIGEDLLLLSESNGACVALTPSETDYLVHSV